MNLKELTDLIAIRQYVVNSTANPAIDRNTVAYMNDTLLLLDKKIIALLQGDDFKKYMDYSNIRQAREDVVNITNIKSGLQRNPYTLQLEKKIK
jgi:hypothetical protein